MRPSHPLVLTATLVAASLPAQLLGSPVAYAHAGTIDDVGFLSALHLADVNGDGTLDLVAIKGSTLFALLGDGSGGFGAPSYSAPLPGAFGWSGSFVGDVDGDGDPDLLVASQLIFSGPYLGQGFLVLLGDGGGTFVDSGFASMSTVTFQVADFDRDGLVDAVGSSSVGQPLEIVKGLGSGAFAAPTSIALPPGIPTPFVQHVLSVRDLNADGHPDLAIADAQGGFTLFGDGQGGFPTGTAIPQNIDGFPIQLRTVADVDGDGSPDLTTGSGLVLWNDGSGAFTTLGQLPAPPSAPFPTTRFVDMNGDGLVDIVRATSAAVTIELAYGVDGFSAPIPYATGLGSRVDVGDVDGDGRPDVVVDGGDSLHVLRNLLPTPSGLAAFGTGTPTCRGAIGVWGTPEPTIGEAAFGVACSNAPPEAPGLLAIGTKVANGWDPLGLGLVLHLGFALPVAATYSDSGGSARFGIPVPAIPFLAGLTAHVQSFWLSDVVFGDTCSPAMFDLASSRGLSITLQQ